MIISTCKKYSIKKNVMYLNNIFLELENSYLVIIFVNHSCKEYMRNNDKYKSIENKPYI